MKQHLLFLGPPGAGKGTQANLISEIYTYLHLSTGELLRQEVEMQSNLGLQVKEIINSGKLVNDELVLEIVKKNLLLNKKGWILDGYPRNLSQANSLNIVLTELNQPLETVFYLNLDEEILVERLLKRGRADDNEKTIRTRLAIYKETTAPLIDFYKNQNILEYIDGDRDLKIISNDIKQKMAL
tara:strand:- start:1102 stop:1653 length:552 start_codon:yes stop_codon:yes gene_type:complete